MKYEVKLVLELLNQSAIDPYLSSPKRTQRLFLMVPYTFVKGTYWGTGFDYSQHRTRNRGTEQGTIADKHLLLRPQ